MDGDGESPPSKLPKLQEATTASSYATSVDFTSLPDDALLCLFSLLGQRDRLAFSSASSHLRRLLLSSPALSSSLDLRPHRERWPRRLSPHLLSLRFSALDSCSAASVLLRHPSPSSLRLLSAEPCPDISNSFLSALTSRFPLLETLQLRECDLITGASIVILPFSCPHLRCLRLQGTRRIDPTAVATLATHSTCLEELAIMDVVSSFSDEEFEFGDVTGFEMLKFVSVAGTTVSSWDSAVAALCKMPRLVGVDFSRTDVDGISIQRMFSESKSLKVACVVNCFVLEEERMDGVDGLGDVGKGNKVLLAGFTDLVKGIESLSSGSEEIMNWVEWVLADAFSAFAHHNSGDDFWFKQGGIVLLVRMLRSQQEDVLERAASVIVMLLDISADAVSSAVAEMVAMEGGVPLLLGLARSLCECIQYAAAKALHILARNYKASKVIVGRGGINVLCGLLRSKNTSVAMEAAGGLWNLSLGEDFEMEIVEAGGVNALLDLVFACPLKMNDVECAVGALADLASFVQCRLQISEKHVLRSFITLAQECVNMRVQEQILKLGMRS